MPAYAYKQDALGGRGVVFSYVNNPSKFYWRQLVEGERRYRTKLIANARSLEEALVLCLDVYVSLQTDSNDTETHPTPSTRASKIDIGISTPKTRNKQLTRAITGEIASFIHHELGRVEAGLIKENTWKEKRCVLTKTFTSYLIKQGVMNVGDITPTFLDDYIIYRGETTKLTRNKELCIIKDFIDNWLIRNGYLTTPVLIKKPRIKKSDLDANPAITPKDWRLINNFIRYDYLKEGEAHPNPSVHYWRFLFWTFTTLAKQTGARPNELLALRWKDVEVEDIGRYSKTNDEVEERLISYITIKTSKTGEQREVPSNSGSLFKRWAAYQRNYVETHKPHLTITRNTLVFSNPNHELQPYCYANYTRAWKIIRQGVDSKLEGNKFSDRNYTIYSFRSSFIEDHISKGTDIYLLSRLAGHSVAMLQRHYDRSDVRKFSEEITKIEFGKKKKTRKVIDLFD
jgi:integrase